VVESDLQDGDGHGPDVRVDAERRGGSEVESKTGDATDARVLTAANPLGTEVVRRSNECSGQAVHELARHTEIA
jgi:hypothetical protein